MTSDRPTDRPRDRIDRIDRIESIESSRESSRSIDVDRSRIDRIARAFDVDVDVDVERDVRFPEASIARECVALNSMHSFRTNARPSSRASSSSSSSRRRPRNSSSSSSIARTLANGRRRSNTARDARASRRTGEDTESKEEKIDGFGFAAAGFLFPYHVGAWRALRDELDVMDAESPFAGSSAGALVAVLRACAFTPNDGERILRDILRDLRANGVVGRVGGVLERALRRELPANAHELCSRGKVFVSVSSFRAYSRDERERMRQTSTSVPFFALEGELISEFSSFDDLIGALLASCHIPLYCGWPARRYRGKWCVDGGWFDLAPVPPNAKNAVRVCGIPLLDAWRQADESDGAFAPDARFWAGWGDRPLIAPDAAGGTPELDYKTTITWALFPASDEDLQRLERLGREDALRWARANGYATNRPISIDASLQTTK